MDQPAFIFLSLSMTIALGVESFLFREFCGRTAESCCLYNLTGAICYLSCFRLCTSCIDGSSRFLAIEPYLVISAFHMINSGFAHRISSHSRSSHFHYFFWSVQFTPISALIFRLEKSGLLYTRVVPKVMSNNCL